MWVVGLKKLYLWSWVKPNISLTPYKHWGAIAIYSISTLIGTLAIIVLDAS